MCVSTTEAELDRGLPIDQIEKRLVACAERHHLEERKMAFWLLEIDRRKLYDSRGFSSIGDYAFELAGIKPRKAQYLVFIASRLEKLPAIADAFDSAELSWTKAREIVKVATLETEQEWLEKARLLSNRDLEKQVRRHEGSGSGEFATLTISLPVELLEMWNDCYELAERLSAAEIEKWQVLEPMMAEYLSTCLPVENDVSGSHHETEDEKALPPAVRNAVLDRDGWQCTVPWCAMRKMLDVHHIEFRSHGGSHDPHNLICLCRLHHSLIHRGVCKVSGRVGLDLKFERPRLFTERPHTAAVEPPSVGETEEVHSPASESTEPAEHVETERASESDDWRDEEVAAIFDGPPTPKPPPKYGDYGDVLLAWLDAHEARKREERSHRRRRKLGRRAAAAPARSDEHVFAASEHVFTETSGNRTPAQDSHRVDPTDPNRLEGAP